MGPNKAADVQEIHDRLKFVTAHVIDRVEAEFDHLEHFAMFDVIALREAYGCTDPDTAKSRKVKLNRYVQKLAQDLRVDGVTAVLEYMDVAKLIFNQTSPGRPLATKSNNEVWSAMLRPNVALSNFPQRRTMQALHVIIRFYLSIEDGECPNERDLGDLANIMAEHKVGTDVLADDVVLAQTDPITTTDIRMCESAVGGVVQHATLGPKGRAWARLWRSVFGARIGCKKNVGKVIHNHRKRPGTYAAAKAGVLAAAEYAVAHYRLHNGTPQGGSSAIGDLKPAFGNEKFERFAKLTAAKKQAAKLRCQLLNRANPRLVWQAKRAAATARPLAGIKRVCFLGDVGASLPHPVSTGLEEVQGPRRSLRADVVVVDDLTRLQVCSDSDEATVNQVLAIVGRGLPVVTRASWCLAMGDPTRVPKESIIRHRPLAMETKMEFTISPHFRARSGNIAQTLQTLTTMPGSKWKLAPAGAAGPNRLDLDGNGVDCLRSWIQKTRRIINVVGSRVWTPAERVM